MVNLIFIIVGAISVAQVTLSENTGILQYYNGALTNVVCSTATPSFLINAIYTSQHYYRLPGLFGIEAKVASDRSNVTLHINGSILAHNVTIQCQNVVDTVLGQTEVIYQLTLLFADTIPAPYDIQYNDETGVLNWNPPRIEEILNIGNITIALGITHYIIYVTDLKTGMIVNFTTNGPETSIAIKPDMPCPVSIQVGAVNPAGESQRSTSITKNQCSSDVGTGLVDSTTEGMMDTENDNSAEKILLSYGGTAAVVIAVVLVAIIVVCITLLTVCYLSKYRRNLRTTKSKKVVNQENPEEIIKSRLSSEVSDASEDSKTELFTPSNSPMTTPKQPATTCQQVQSLENKEDTNNMDKEKRVGTETQLCIQCIQGDGQLIYAELAPPVVNPVSQPSSVENTAYAVINHTNQTD